MTIIQHLIFAAEGALYSYVRGKEIGLLYICDPQFDHKYNSLVL